MRFKPKYSLKTIFIPLITYNIYFTSSNLQDQSSPMIFPTHKIIDLFHKTKHIQNSIRYSNYTRIHDWSGGFMPVRTICLVWFYDLARSLICRSRREKLKNRFPFRLKGDGCLVRDCPILKSMKT